MPPLVMLPAVPLATTLGMAAGQVPVQGVAPARQEASGLLRGAAGSLLRSGTTGADPAQPPAAPRAGPAAAVPAASLSRG